MRLRSAISAAIALGLSACAPAQDFRPSAPPPSAAPAHEAPPPAPPPPPRSTPPKLDPDDKCGAAAMQQMVGRPRTEIPIPLKPELQRVACTTCPVTMDFNEKRLNFFYDAKTGIIKEVRCG